MDFPFAKLAEDIAADLPAGSDLELEGDAGFMRFMAQIEGVLPQSFANFDRGAADLPAHLDEVAALLLRSKDLRLITTAAKLFILNRDLSGFERLIGALAQWLGERWDALFPELLDGDPMMRLVALQSLDDIPHTVKPLEAAPLFKSRRAGAVSLRLALLADGKLAPRQGDDGENEKVPSPGDITSAIREADLEELVAARDQARRLQEALAAIERLWDERTGRAGELRLAELRPKAMEVANFLDRAVASRDPSLALAPAQEDAGAGVGGDQPAADAPAGAVASLADAREAMAAAERYLREVEPSSPVRLILAQATALLGRSFYEALEQLVPEVALQAGVSLGRDLPLRLPMQRLAQLLPSEGGTPPVEAGEATAENADQESWSAPAEEPAGQDWSEEPAAPMEMDAGPPRFVARNRAEALALLDAAGAYFRTAEPSSPIPLLLGIARNAAGRDFMSLVRDAIPAQLLRVDE